MNQWLICVVALILGMLAFHMLSNVCGCKNVEGLKDCTNDKTLSGNGRCEDGFCCVKSPCHTHCKKGTDHQDCASCKETCKKNHPDNSGVCLNTDSKAWFT